MRFLAITPVHFERVDILHTRVNEQQTVHGNRLTFRDAGAAEPGVQSRRQHVANLFQEQTHRCRISCTRIIGDCDRHAVHIRWRRSASGIHIINVHMRSRKLPCSRQDWYARRLSITPLNCGCVSSCGVFEPTGQCHQLPLVGRTGDRELIEGGCGSLILNDDSQCRSGTDQSRIANLHGHDKRTDTCIGMLQSEGVVRIQRQGLKSSAIAIIHCRFPADRVRIIKAAIHTDRIAGRQRHRGGCQRNLRSEGTANFTSEHDWTEFGRRTDGQGRQRCSMIYAIAKQNPHTKLSCRSILICQ